nr:MULTISPECIES: hypothetical protein [Vibrio]
MQKKDDKKQVSPVLSQFEETAVISDSAQVTPVLVYGKRHIKKEKLAEFKHAYQAHSKSAYEENPDIKAIFAFPDTKDPLAYWHTGIFYGSEVPVRLTITCLALLRQNPCGISMITRLKT